MNSGDTHPNSVSEADLQRLTTWTLVRAGRRWEAVITELLAPHALTPVQFGVLAQLSAEPLLTQSELARRVLMRAQSMNHLLDTMIRRGLVTRSGDRGRGRRNPLLLTAAGMALLTEVWPVVVHANSAEFLDLDPAQLTALNDVLHHLLTSEPQSRSGKAPLGNDHE